MRFFFSPLYFLLPGMPFRIETHFFFYLRQKDLSLKGNTTCNEQQLMLLYLHMENSPCTVSSVQTFPAPLLPPSWSWLCRLRSLPTAGSCAGGSGSPWRALQARSLREGCACCMPAPAHCTRDCGWRWDHLSLRSSIPSLVLVSSLRNHPA